MTDDLRSQFNDPKILLGQQSGSHIERSSLAVNKTVLTNGTKEQTENKKLSDFLDILDSLKSYIQRLEDDIEKMEGLFRERDGDAWREKLALKILDPDEVPQQREGESIEDYRKRLEPLLINKMLNPDGTIKNQYKNHPELGDYAQWAQKKHHLNIARGYVRELKDPNTTPERREEIEKDMRQNTGIETLVFADQEAPASSDTQSRVKDIGDSIEDSNLTQDQNTGANAFLKI